MPAHTCTLTGCFAVQNVTSSYVKNSLCILGLILRWLSFLATTKPSVCFQLNITLISKDHIGEVVAAVCLSKFHLFHIAYELAVGAPPESPPQWCPASKNSPQIHCISQASKKDMQLTGSGLIILTHLLLYNSSHLFSYYCPPTTASLPSDST